MLSSAQFYLSDKNIDEVKKNFELLVHLYFIKLDFNKILKYVNLVGKDNLLNSILTKKSYDNSNAWTLYRIGEAYNGSGDILNAYIFYKKSDELSPFNPEFKNKLGASLMAQKNIPQAIKIFESILVEDPKFVQAINNLGYANLVSGNPQKAEELYNRALKLDPDYESLLMNIVGLKIYQKKYKEAEEVLKKVLKKNPKNEQAIAVLKQLKGLN
ncbi:MAG: tetratricopeptide repeat protein [Bacteroidetes bacterium]|nr:tetratricopeptide repeat protein [Bacteroidota bacterium]